MNTTVHKVIHAFLFAEYNSLKNPWKKDHINLIITTTHVVDTYQVMNQPNFSSNKENEARYRALMSIRRDSWFNLPPDLLWKEVSFDEIEIDKIVLLCPKTTEELQLYNEIKTLDLTGILLIQQNDKYYVIEGNHRISEYLSKSDKEIKYGPIFVGYSVTGMNCPLINLSIQEFENPNHKVKFYAEEKVINHWSQLYEEQINPDCH